MGVSEEPTVHLVLTQPLRVCRGGGCGGQRRFTTRELPTEAAELEDLPVGVAWAAKLD